MLFYVTALKFEILYFFITLYDEIFLQKIR